MVKMPFQKLNALLHYDSKLKNSTSNGKSVMKREKQIQALIP